MPRSKRKADPDEADTDYQPQLGSAENDNDNDDYVEKPAAKRGRRSTTGSTATSRKSTTSRASKASKAAAHIPFEPHPIDDPIPEAPAPQLRNPPHISDTSSHGLAEISPLAWEVPVAVPETATSWWKEMIELDPGNPDSTVLLLEDVAFSTSTLLSFPDPEYLDPETFAFIGPPEFSFFQVPHLMREPRLRAMRPKLLPDGRGDADGRGNQVWEPTTYSLPIDDYSPLLDSKFPNTPDDQATYSKAFNNLLQDDEHLRLYREKNQHRYNFHGGRKPLDSLQSIQFVPRAHIVRPATVLAVGETPHLDPTHTFLFESADDNNPITEVSWAMEDYIAILVRPHSGESYTTHEQVERAATPADGADSESRPSPVLETQERTSWSYVASVYLRLDKLQGILTAPNKVEAQKVVHDVLQLFHQTRSGRRRPARAGPNESLASSSDFSLRASQLEISSDPIPTFVKRSSHWDKSHVIAQVGPNGPFYDPDQGLFASQFTMLSGEPTHKGYCRNQLVHTSRSSGFAGRPVCDSSTGNHQRLLNALHLIAAQPCTHPEPIPVAFLPRIPSRATLIVTSAACLARWERLARQVLGSTASIVVILSSANLCITPLSDILLADMVIMSNSVLLQSTVWVSSDNALSDFTLCNATPNKLLLPPSCQGTYYYGRQVGANRSSETDRIRTAAPCHRFTSIAAKGGACSTRFLDPGNGLTADVTLAYWHRIVMDHWTEVSPLHSLLASRAWVALGTSPAKEPSKAAGFKEGGVFLDQAHQLAVDADAPDAPEPVIECSLQQVFTSPLDLALSTIEGASAGRHSHPWALFRSSLQGMRAADDCRAYPYLASASLAKWNLSKLADLLDKVAAQIHTSFSSFLTRALEAIQRLFTVAKQYKAIEIALLVLDRDLGRQKANGEPWIKELLQDMSNRVPEANRNAHIDLDRYELVCHGYDPYAYRPKTRSDDDCLLTPDALRALDAAIRSVDCAVQLVASARADWDLCEGVLRLVRNTAVAEGWMAKVVQDGSEDVCCPECGAELADDDKLVVTSVSDCVSCERCPHGSVEHGCQELSYEFYPIANIKRSHDWHEQLVKVEKRGSNKRIWPRAFIQTLVLQAINILSADDMDSNDAEDDDHRSGGTSYSNATEPKRIAIFLSVDHIKAAANCFKLLNIPHVIVDNKSIYKPLKALYESQPDLGHMPTDADADDDTRTSNGTPGHIPIVLVDAAWSRMARLRIPGVSHVFLSSGWRSSGASTCIATALRPPNEEQSVINVTSFFGDWCCEPVPLDVDAVQLPPRMQE